MHGVPSRLFVLDLMCVDGRASPVFSKAFATVSLVTGVSFSNLIIVGFEMMSLSRF